MHITRTGKRWGYFTWSCPESLATLSLRILLPNPDFEDLASAELAPFSTARLPRTLGGCGLTGMDHVSPQYKKDVEGMPRRLWQDEDCDTLNVLVQAYLHWWNRSIWGTLWTIETLESFAVAFIIAGQWLAVLFTNSAFIGFRKLGMMFFCKKHFLL